MKGWLLALVFWFVLQWLLCPAQADYKVIIKPGEMSGYSYPACGSQSDLEKVVYHFKRRDRGNQYSDHKDIVIFCDCAKGMKAWQGAKCEANERDAAQGKTSEVLQRCTREKIDRFESYLANVERCGGCLSGTVQLLEEYGTKRRPFKTVEQLDQEERQRRQFQEHRRELGREEERRRMADPKWQQLQEEKRAQEQADRERRKERKEEQARNRKDGTYDRERELRVEQQRQAADEDLRRRMERGWRPKERPNR